MPKGFDLEETNQGLKDCFAHYLNAGQKDKNTVLTVEEISTANAILMSCVEK